MKIQYKIITGINPLTVSKDIALLLNDGWNLSSPLNTVTVMSTVHYIQSMVKTIPLPKT